MPNLQEYLFVSGNLTIDRNRINIGMEIKQAFTDKLNKLISYWTAQGIQLNPGTTIDKIKTLEADSDFTFEEDFHTYLRKVDGFVDFCSDEAWFSFWSQNRMREENEDGSLPKDIIWFSDHSINLCSFGFYKTNRKVYSSYQTIGRMECVANSFMEFIDLYLENPYQLLR